MSCSLHVLRIFLVGIIGLGALLAGAEARADEPVEDVRAVRVRYDVAEGCPTRTWFEGTLHFRSSRIVPVGPEEEGAYEADVQVTSAKEGFHGSLRITPRGGEETTREIDGARCQTVVEALGFTIALLLDPDGVNSATLPSDVELARLASSARAKVVAPPPPPPPTSVVAASERPSPAQPTASRMHLLAEIGGGAWSAVRGVGPRGHLAVELRLPRRSLSPFAKLGGFLQPSGEATAPAGTVSYLPTGGRLDLGVLVDVGASVRVGGGAHVTVLAMPVDAPSAQERLPSVRVVPSAGPALRATWEPSRFGVSLDVSGGAHTVRERFQIEDSTGRGEVFRLPGVYVQATIGLVVRFVDLRTPFGT